MNKTSHAVESSFAASTSAGKHNGTLTATLSETAGRILLASLFLVSGVVCAYSGTVAYLPSGGLPEAALPLVVGIEVFGGVALILGWKTRAVAILLAALTVSAAFIFHSNLADPTQMIMFLKDVSIAGGLLLLAANGAGPLSVDRIVR